jgi:hypothetical protein
MIRLPDCCNGDAETTVLAHIRLIGVSGMGTKGPDVLAAFACSACHTAVDAGLRGWTREQLQLAHWQGVGRTINYWLKNGMVKV